ncbi:MAG: DUF5050 domain-containing protein [Chloroflexi bacterium]|nr:DUF5050 domain-containing protein [Chloroflexota bacterium]
MVEDLYYGREDSFQRLNELLAAGSSLLLLFGKRYWGKTSFLHQLSLRLGGAYRTRYLDLTVVDQQASPLWLLITSLGNAVQCSPPDKQSFERDPVAYLRDYVHSLREPAADALPFLICLDAIPVDWIATNPEWSNALGVFSSVLREAGGPTVLLAVEGHPVELGQVALPNLPRILLSPLTEEEADDLLTVPVRGHLAYDFEAIGRIHRLSGGHPFFLQLFGHILFEQRASVGWVSMPEVDQVVDEVIERGAPQFESIWNTCSPPAQVVLACFAEMLGSHGIAGNREITQYVGRQRIQMPARDIDAALFELAEQGILERLGGSMYRVSMELFRAWVKAHHTLLDTVRQTKRYRRVRARRFSPLSSKRIDWFGLLLWVLAGAIALLIAVMWRTRDGGSLWPGRPAGTPDAQEAGIPAEVAVRLTPLPTLEAGAIPGQILYIGKARPEDKWAIYSMRSDGSDRVRLTDGTSNDTCPVRSPDGTKIAFCSDRDGNREIYVMNADGSQPVNLTKNAAEDWTPSWSPDGKRIAYASFESGNWEIYVMNANGGGVKRLTENESADYSPVWSPDGLKIAFVSNRDGNLEIYVMDADGSNQTRFTNEAATDQSPNWSPDGKQLVWESYRENNMEILAANLDGTNLRNLSQDAYADDHGPTWSPWRNQIAYFSNRAGGWDIYTLHLDTGERVNITNSEGMLEQAPHWSQ